MSPLFHSCRVALFRHSFLPFCPLPTICRFPFCRLPTICRFPFCRLPPFCFLPFSFLPFSFLPFSFLPSSHLPHFFRDTTSLPVSAVSRAQFQPFPPKHLRDTPQAALSAVSRKAGRRTAVILLPRHGSRLVAAAGISFFFRDTVGFPVSAVSRKGI